MVDHQPETDGSVRQPLRYMCWYEFHAGRASCRSVIKRRAACGCNSGAAEKQLEAHDPSLQVKSVIWAGSDCAKAADVILNG